MVLSSRDPESVHMPNFTRWLKSDGVPASFAEKRLANILLRYWEELRGQRRMPLISDLDFNSIIEFMPHAFNIDLTSGVHDPIFRYIGSELATDCGEDLTNKRACELSPQSLLARTMRRVGEVVTSGEPVTISDRFVNSENNEILYRAVLLPFSRTGEQIDNIIGALKSKVVPFAAARNVAVAHHEPVDANCVNAEPLQTKPSNVVSHGDKLFDSWRRPGADKAGVAGAQGGAEWAHGVGARGQVIVVGSAKGGTGKSTTAMHLIASLLYEGRVVGSIDLDTPQQTLSRYIENRWASARESTRTLPMPDHLAFPEAVLDMGRLEADLKKLRTRCDSVVIDTPGSDTPVSRWAHALADIVITPINDSFVDLDTLAVLDPESEEVLEWGHYAEMVARARKQKLDLSGSAFDWIVMRNRLTNLNAKNKERMATTLEHLSASLGFSNQSGLSERVIYREMFLEGLTLLDLVGEDAAMPLTMSHIAARQELRMLFKALNLRAVTPV